MIISEKLSKKISSDLTDRGLINKEYLESYAYSLEFLFDMILFNISLIILGAVLRRIIPAVIFIAVMTPIKTVAGGAHGRSRISCEIISYSIFLVIILLPAIISPDPVICFFLSALLASGIIILSPVDTSARKRVSNNRKRLRILCVIFCSAIILLEYIFCLNMYYNGVEVIFLCLLVIFANQIIGLITIRLNRNRK